MRDHPDQTTRRRVLVEFVLDNLVWFILIVVARGLLG